MTHKEIIQELENIIDQTDRDTLYNGIRLFIRRLDPPRPEQGTVVWWSYANDTRRNYLGIVAEGDDGVIDSEQEFHEWQDIEYKPAHILGPQQVAVDVPPVREWPEDGTHVEAAVTGYSDEWWFAEVITRAEAERMEAKHGE